MNKNEATYNIILLVEKILLGFIAGLTLAATGQEVINIYQARSIELADLLMLFIYTEVLGMIAVFLKNNRIPITMPLFIAITALARLIILQGKEMDPITILYEAGAILIIALACLVMRYRPPSQYEDDKN